jgi:uncharacterized protein YebE (UPF0316 family)
VAVGTVLGLVVNDRLNPGGAVVEVVVPGDGSDLRPRLPRARMARNDHAAIGITGAATVLFLVVRTRRTDEVLEVIRAAAPDAFWTTRPATAVHGSPGMATSVSL